MPDRYLICCLSSILLAIAAWWPSQAAAQVHRCTGPDGNSFYSDRPCEYFGGVERVPRGQSATSPSSRGVRVGCARTLRDLVSELTAAFDARDANRLAGVAHWVGMSTQGAYRQMERLDALAKRPLLDIVPVYPEPRIVEPPPSMPEPATGQDSATTSPPPQAFSLEGHGQDVPVVVATLQQPPQSPPQVDADAPYPQTTQRSPPVALRIEQSHGNGISSSSTVFGLQRHLGCWWIRL